jgi:hypothetical protein
MKLDLTARLDFAAPRPEWTRYDDAVVAQARGRRASWDAVAAMLGRSTPDVRRRYDPSWPADEAADEAAEVPEPQPARTVRDKALRLRLLALLQASPSRAAALARAIDRSDHETRSALLKMEQRGLVEVGQGFMWRITPAGRAMVEGLE